MKSRHRVVTGKVGDRVSDDKLISLMSAALSLIFPPGSVYKDVTTGESLYPLWLTDRSWSVHRRFFFQASSRSSGFVGKKVSA